MKIDMCSQGPSEFKCLGSTVGGLLRSVYGIERYQLISSFPLDREFYVINAKFPVGTSERDLVLMKRNLLAQRFGLAVHEETRDMPVYELTIPKGGHKLRTPEPAGDGPTGGTSAPQASQRGVRTVPDKDGLPVLPPGKPGIAAVSFRPEVRISARMQPISALLEMVKSELGRPVVDKTGLTGVYDYTLTFAFRDVIKPLTATETTNEPSDPGLNIAQAFGSQLGLVLKPVKGPVKVLIVDHIEQRPTEN
jgi:uncharacterized protein (TIGR03435 family)